MSRIVVVFGGTGFLGRRIVHRLSERRYAVRVASRHPQRWRTLPRSSSSPEPQVVAADIHDQRSVAASVVGVQVVVNAVSLYMEHGDETFQ